MKRVGDGIRDILQQARQMGASDVHLASGRAPLFRVDGRLVNLPGAGPVEPGELDALWAAAAHSSPPAGRRNRSGERDVALELEGVGRIRANVFQSMGARAAVVRLIPPDIPGLDALGLPPSAVELAGHQHGLVLVAGPAGSGKSTTLAAMVQEISRNRDCHVVTLEDPVEYVHPADGRALVRQREVGVDTESFALGLRAALRQDPDVLVVGEMRDVESMHIALVAAETGHLVLSSLHAPSAVQAIDRIVDS
ncbi:MAG: ATPase, T2SS/T4P/T4SS family, partial [Syntrophomonadaceae bacterium]|nr:ATPase, T2SS/T4P/T4SS family [Syntrophomonadaceae bacterium]